MCSLEKRGFTLNDFNSLIWGHNLHLTLSLLFMRPDFVFSLCIVYLCSSFDQITWNLAVILLVYVLKVGIKLVCRKSEDPRTYIGH